MAQKNIVNSIALVKPERAKAVEHLLIRMAQTGQIAGKVDSVTHTHTAAAAGVVEWLCLKAQLSSQLFIAYILCLINPAVWLYCLAVCTCNTSMKRACSMFLHCQVGEPQLVELLEKFSQQTQKKTTVKVWLFSWEPNSAKIYLLSYWSLWLHHYSFFYQLYSVVI